MKRTETKERPHHTHTAIHMPIPWESMYGDGSVPAVKASLAEKTALVGRVGFLLLSAGSGAWRVRDLMSHAAEGMNVICSEDIGLTVINLTCFDESGSCSLSLSLRTTGINTDKLKSMSDFIRSFKERAETVSVKEFHEELAAIDRKPGFYKPWNLGLAAGVACGAFTYLLGGGLVEMVCALLGACAGNYLRMKMLHRKLALFACVAASVAMACAVYVAAEKLCELAFGVSQVHQAGYICAMLFIIPGFPLILGGIDIAKLDMRSGLERVLYGVLIILIATQTGMVVAMLLHFKPGDLEREVLNPGIALLLKAVMSFFGVYGFSLMFNSSRRMAATAGLIGMAANTLRLVLIEEAGVVYFIAAFIGALTAGLLASAAKLKTGFPRMSLTVPSVVIMVPGMYLYRGFYTFGQGQLGVGGEWLIKAFLIILALPLGLVTSRLITDSKFRHCT